MLSFYKQISMCKIRNLVLVLGSVVKNRPWRRHPAMVWLKLKDPPWKGVWRGGLSWQVMVAAIHHGTMAEKAA